MQESKFEIEKQKSLKEFTSWEVGGSAQFYCAPHSVEDLKTALSFAADQALQVTILGGGTNTLVSDKGVRGLVIHTIHLNQVEIEETSPDLLVCAGGGAQKSEVLKVFMKHRLAPAIFLAGLPGDMAGGVVMNAGVGHNVLPREFCEIVDKIEVLSLDEERNFHLQQFKNDEIKWHYRKSLNWQPGVITRVWVKWPNEPNDEILKQVRDGNKRRKSTQPLNWPSCGSVFKNPEGDHAGRLIEASGLKGFQMGGAQVSEKHANFIVNLGEATATDIHQLICHVQNTVEGKFGIRLTNEVVYLGDWA